MATETVRETPAQALDRHIREHREEAARLREQYGDPDAALSAFVRANFTWEALSESYQEVRDHPGLSMEGAVPRDDE